MTPGQSESNMFDRIIASYEWLLNVSSFLNRDTHAWHIAEFNLAELKMLRKRLEIGPVYIDGIVTDDQPDVSPVPQGPPHG